MLQRLVCLGITHGRSLNNKWKCTRCRLTLGNFHRPGLDGGPLNFTADDVGLQDETRPEFISGVNFSPFGRRAPAADVQFKHFFFPFWPNKVKLEWMKHLDAKWNQRKHSKVVRFMNFHLAHRIRHTFIYSEIKFHPPAMIHWIFNEFLLIRRS